MGSMGIFSLATSAFPSVCLLDVEGKSGSETRRGCRKKPLGMNSDPNRREIGL